MRVPVEQTILVVHRIRYESTSPQPAVPCPLRQPQALPGVQAGRTILALAEPQQLLRRAVVRAQVQLVHLLSALVKSMASELYSSEFLPASLWCYRPSSIMLEWSILSRAIQLYVKAFMCAMAFLLLMERLWTLLYRFSINSSSRCTIIGIAITTRSFISIAIPAF